MRALLALHQHNVLPWWCFSRHSQVQADLQSELIIVMSLVGCTGQVRWWCISRLAHVLRRGQHSASFPVIENVVLDSRACVHSPLGASGDLGRGVSWPSLA